ncbi:MAG: TonB-dependent receptor [Myxococcales bacterium]|nr:TonB-dependent receptor [Myxococcales bacterium]
MKQVPPAVSIALTLASWLAGVATAQEAPGDPEAPPPSTSSANDEVPRAGEGARTDEAEEPDTGSEAHTHEHTHVIRHSHPHDPREAHEHPVHPSYGARARVRRPRTAASASTVRALDLRLRPRVRPFDILMAVPGMYVAQHAGGGKANQYFLRGFDADHGTDVALSVDGIPVNMVSHGHGQGYADLHFVIPELVERVEVRKGPYFAEDGDFATAGAIDLHLAETLDESVLSVTGGLYESWRLLGAISGASALGRGLLAAEVAGAEGPFDYGEDLRRYNVLGRLTTPVGSGRLVLTAASYAARWDASGQLPLRAVTSGLVDRFGALDPLEGGDGDRHALSVAYRHGGDEEDELELMAWALRYRLSLFSNFTFFSAHPDLGDMIHQRDERTMSGLRARWQRDLRLGRLTLRTLAGVGARADSIDASLGWATGREDRERIVDAHIEQRSIAAFAETDAAWDAWLHLILGLRADFFTFDVRDELGMRAARSHAAERLSPKASLVLAPTREVDAYLNFGMGYHSNDARAVVAGGTPLARAVGGEVGARLRWLERFDVALAAFLLDLESEIVWVGDEGTTEASGATRRMGLELEARARLLPWLYADLDVTLVRARFVDEPEGADEVPLAPRLLLNGGLSARHPSGIYGRVGLFHMGARPATEDGFIEARGMTRLDAVAGYRGRGYEIALSGSNLLDADVYEAQFATVSRLRGEDGPEDCPAGTRASVADDGTFEGCEDLSFTPGWPIDVRLTASVYF